MFRKRAMRKIYKSTWQEVTRDYTMRSFTKLFLGKYHSGDKITNEMGEACCTYGGGDRTSVYWVLVGTTERKRPLGRPRRR